ncbi:type-1 angiotensin II receptor-associated protein isoform X2 [Hemitrygon akajei]|uniref:type-1 angiotensin II receptor-associated protein isoform X2 n=1 Tax=Hemitrygon akajei TaxID=2704970 RepID=UPI003BF9E771
MALPVINLKMIIFVHWLLTTWGCLCFWLPGPYIWSNYAVLAIGVWAIAQRDSIDAIFMVFQVYLVVKIELRTRPLVSRSLTASLLPHRQRFLSRPINLFAICCHNEAYINILCLRFSSHLVLNALIKLSVFGALDFWSCLSLPVGNVAMMIIQGKTILL